MSGRALTVVAEPPVVAMCAGRDCRTRGEFAKMRKALHKQCDVIELRCVGLCNGPVVVIDAASNAPSVYAKLRTKRQRKLVVAAAAGERRARRDLAGRRVTRQKVVTRVSRQVGRRSGVRRVAA